MIKKIFNDFFGSAIIDIKKIKIIKRRKKLNEARRIIIEEARYYLDKKNYLASKTFIQVDNNLKFAIKYLIEEYDNLEEGVYYDNRISK